MSQSGLLMRGLRLRAGGAGVTSRIPTRKVAFAPLHTTATTSLQSTKPSRSPALQRYNRRLSPVLSNWSSTRHCSSHASSSLVKMATDRDILSDEYVSYRLSLLCSCIMDTDTIFLQREAYQLRHLPLRPPAKGTMDLPGSRSNRPRRQEVHEIDNPQHT